ncbi:MAG: 50S ribosomal protein L11 methyltransferase [Deltaproteobacteria bacterium]|nr:50S ribosomal protein L11 methyltransferase [Deltaproteobacteria bacterium]
MNDHSFSSYHVVSLDLEREALDLTEAVLYSHGCLGLEEMEAGAGAIRLKTYFDDREPLSQFVSKLSALLPQAENVQGTTISLNDIRFQAQTFEPIELVPDVWIVPPDDMPTETKVKSGRKIVIRPGAAFGTGRHESTQLAAEMLEEICERHNSPQPPLDSRGGDQGVESLLDIGTGSGILAIHARKLGIPRVEAVEIDELACINARENFALNGCGDLLLFPDLSQVRGPFDVIVANIVTPTIIQLKETMKRFLKENGVLILAGITDAERERIEGAFVDFKFLNRTQKKEWLCYAYRRI